MKYKLTIGIALLATLLPSCERGVTPLAEEGSLVISERISNLTVNDFAEDKDGHIWIATSRGLNKYTVNEFQQFYCQDDTLGLPDNQVNVIHSSRDGNLWVATSGGVALRTSRGGFTRVPVLDRNQGIRYIMETGDGEMLMSNGNTLLKYDRKEKVLRPVLRDLNSFGAHTCMLSRDGRLWNVTDNGMLLNCYNSSDFSLIQSIPVPYPVYHICDAGNGELWISGMGRLSILDSRSMQWKELPAAIRGEKRLMNGDIDVLFSPDDRSMLLNVIGKGFFYYSRTRETVLFRDDAGFPFDIPDTEIRSIFQDSSGNIWFGTADRGFPFPYANAVSSAATNTLQRPSRARISPLCVPTGTALSG